MFTATKIAVLGGDSFRDEYSLAFDGTDDYINFGNTLNLGTGDFSISVWIKAPLDFNDTRILIKKQNVDNRYMLSCDTNNPPRLNFIGRIGGSSTIEYVGGTTISLDNLINQWVHFVISADRDGDVVGYINGALDASPGTDTVDDTDIDNTGNLQIGRHDTVYYDQSISEIAYYDKALSANEVATIYNGREPYNHKEGVASGNLTAWWRMGDGNIDRLQSQPVVSDENDISLGVEMWDADKQSSGDVTGWAGYDNNTIEDNGSEIKITYVDHSAGAYLQLRDSNQLSSNLTIGQTYQIKFDVKVNGGSVNYIEYDGSTAALVLDAFTNTSYVTKTYFLKAKHATTPNIRIGNMGSGEIAYMTNFSCRPIGGLPGHSVNMTLSDFEQGAK